MSECKTEDWQPIGTLPSGIYTDVVLWNPCDGVHLAPFAEPEGIFEEIRRGGIYTHWRRLKPPKKLLTAIRAGT